MATVLPSTEPHNRLRLTLFSGLPFVLILVLIKVAGNGFDTRSGYGDNFILA